MIRGLYKIRWHEENTPIMRGHMHNDVWLYNYLAKLPRIKRQLCLPIRGFREKRYRFE